MTRDRLADWLPKCARDDVVLASDGLSGRHRSGDSWVRLIEISALDISASDIRARLREGRSVRYLLPEAVLTAVMESGSLRAAMKGQRTERRREVVAEASLERAAEEVVALDVRELPCLSRTSS